MLGNRLVSDEREKVRVMLSPRRKPECYSQPYRQITELRPCTCSWHSFHPSQI